jgi:uncharacterized RDD family membrane protein YckC
LGLPETGRGSIAGYGARLGSLLIDAVVGYLAGLAVSALAGVHPRGACVTPSNGALVCHSVARATLDRSYIGTGVFLGMIVVLLAFSGRTLGMRLLGLQLVRLDGRPVGALAVPRTLLMALVVPAVIVDRDRRALYDRALGSAVVNVR